jgi:hypothetical protein
VDWLPGLTPISAKLTEGPAILNSQSGGFVSLELHEDPKIFGPNVQGRNASPWLR